MRSVVLSLPLLLVFPAVIGSTLAKKKSFVIDRQIGAGQDRVLVRSGSATPVAVAQPADGRPLHRERHHAQQVKRRHDNSHDDGLTLRGSGN